jgi:hypothetical protein
VPYERLARFVLDEGRAIERQLMTTDLASEEAESLRSEARRLREEYQHLVGEAEAHHRPTPPPFPHEPG